MTELKPFFDSFSLTFVAIFVALDVIGALPIFIRLTSDMSRTERSRLMNQSMLVAFAVALGFVFVGQSVFRLIGIEISDFKMAGGLVLLLISLTDLVHTSEVKQRASGSTGIVPMAVPLITGPGVLTTLILQVENAGYAITLVAMLLNYGLAWLVLRQSAKITHVIGKDGTVVISKLAALFLAAFAVAMIRGGIIQAIIAFHAG